MDSLKKFLRPDVRETNLSNVPLFPPQTMQLAELKKVLHTFKNEGFRGTKISDVGKPSQKTFTLDSTETQLFYTPSQRKGNKATWQLVEVWEIRRGHDTVVFAESLKKKQVGIPENALSLVNRSGMTLNIELQRADDVEVWIQLLRHCVLKAYELYPLTMDLQIKRYWEEICALKNSEQKVAIKDVLTYLKLPNSPPPGSSTEIHTLYAMAARDQHAWIEYEGFRSLYKLASRRTEIDLVFRQFTRKDIPLMPAPVFSVFMREIQGQPNWDDKATAELFKKIGVPAKGMGVGEFEQYLLNPILNGWWNPAHLGIFQDMNQPFNHYWIASSHNTYLTGDQLQSNSSVDMYIRTLKRGSRCVELDCWDGKDGVPIIYHGGTRTSKILFCDVISAINEHAFDVSPFPVFLSLEVHCNPEGQDEMARIMRETFGRKMLPLTPEVKFMELTPDSLRGRILVKAKQLKPENGEGNDVFDDDDDDDDLSSISSRSIMRDASPGYQSSTPRRPSGMDMDGTGVPSLPNGGGDATGPRRESSADGRRVTMQEPEETSPTSASARRRRTSLGLAKRASFVALAQQMAASKKEHVKVKISRALSDTVFLCSIKFKTLQNAVDEGHCWDVESFSEGKSLGLIQKNAPLFGEANKHIIARIYPPGVNVQSENYDPQPHWNVGAQMVALNYQTQDFAMRLNEAKFLQNGKCGYILKPLPLRQEGMNCLKDYTDPHTLIVEVLSGYHLGSSTAIVTSHRRMDSRVEVFISGLPSECKTILRTKQLDYSGFHPVWNSEPFKFPLVTREIGLLTLRILDGVVRMNNKEGVVGEASIPLNALRQGFRIVPLTDPFMNVPLASSFLLCHFHFIARPAQSQSIIRATASQISEPVSGSTDSSMGPRNESIPQLLSQPSGPIPQLQAPPAIAAPPPPPPQLNSPPFIPLQPAQSMQPVVPRLIFDC